MIYLDSSALLKLLYEERESAALSAWLSTQPDVSLISSELVKIEVNRACRRLSDRLLAPARALFASLDLVRLTGHLVDEATEVGPASLRSLDAIHLASALSVGADLSTFISYDRRLHNAAVDARLDAVRPGV